jgi:hypothetical protein
MDKDYNKEKHRQLLKYSKDLREQGKFLAATGNIGLSPAEKKVKTDESQKKSTSENESKRMQTHSIVSYLTMLRSAIVNYVKLKCFKSN